MELSLMDIVQKQRFMEQLLVSFFMSSKFDCQHNLINCTVCCKIVHRFKTCYNNGVCCMGSIDHSKEYKYSDRCNKIKEYCKKIYSENGMCLEIDEDLNYTIFYNKEPKINNAKGEIYRYQPSELVPECKVHYHKDNPYEAVYQTSGAVGFDLALPKHCVFKANKPFKEPLDISFEIPEGYYIEIHPRSSTLIKHNLMCNIGIIDTDYTGIVHLTGIALNDYSLPAGTRLCQAILKKKYIASNIGVVNQERDQNGFGGTGK